MRPKSHKGLLLLLSTGICSLLIDVNANWILIDDFQDFTESAYLESASEFGWLGSGTNLDQFWILPSSDYVQDSADVDNMALYVPSIQNTQLPFTPVCAIKALPEEGIPVGGTGVIYFRCLSLNNFESEWSIGVSDRNLSYDENSGQLVSPRGWSDYNANIQFTTERVLEHRDGDAYISTNPQWETVENDWTAFWIVIENTWDAEENPGVFTGGFTVYAKKPDDTNPVLIKVGTDPAKDMADFRRIPSDDLGSPSSIKWLMVTVPLSVSGNQFRDPFFLDDFYFTSGNKITDPLLYGGYRVNGERDTDTGNFLGWLNTEQAPCIWSYALNGWLYMEEPDANAAGAWAYFYK